MIENAIRNREFGIRFRSGRWLACAAVLLLAASIPSWSPAQDAVPRAESTRNADEPIGFTWWNDLPEMIRRGNEAYQTEQFDLAEERYRDARLRNPNEAASAFNLGLARAKRGDNAGAVRAFDDAMSLAPQNAAVRGNAAYNKGVSLMEMAMAAEQEQNRPGAIAAAVQAIDSFNTALESRDGDFPEAKLNKEQVQHFLQTFAMQPQQPSQQQGEGGEQGQEGEPQDQQQQGQQQQQQQNQQQQSQQQQQQQGQQQQGQPQTQQQQQAQQSIEEMLDQLEQQLENMTEQQRQQMQEQIEQQMEQLNEEQRQQMREQLEQMLEEMTDQQRQRLQQLLEELMEKLDKLDQQEGQAQDQVPQDSEEEPAAQDQTPPGGDPQPSEEMTEEQARQYLNVLGDPELVKLRKGAPRDRPPVEKDW